MAITVSHNFVSAIPDNPDAEAAGEITPSRWNELHTVEGAVEGPASATDNAIARYDGTTGKLVQNSAVTVSDAGDITTSGYVDLAEIATPANPSTGYLRLWAEDNNGHGIAKIVAPNNTVRQLARDNAIVARNTSGSTIAKGKMVYVTGATGQVPNIALADADDPATIAFGMTDEDIADNGFGFVFVIGNVSGLDTSAYSEGTALYLSQTAGEFTSTPPAHPAMQQLIGTVLRQHATQGIIDVDIAVSLGDLYGTRRNDFRLGDANTGAKTLTFVNANTLTVSANPTASRTLTLPDKTGTIATLDDITGGAAWGGITGTLSDQTDLQSALDAKQATLVSATNIKTINGASILGSGDLTVSGGGASWGGITGTLSSQTDLQTALDAKVTDADVRGGAANLSQRLSTISNFASPNAGGLVVGNYYDNAFHGTANTTLAGVANRIDLAPYYTSATFTVDVIGVSCSTAVAGSEVKIVIYDTDTSTGWPNNLLYESAALSTATTGAKSEVTSFQFLSGRQYWLGTWHSSTATLRALNLACGVNLGSDQANGSQYKTVIRSTSTFSGAAPDPWSFSSAQLTTNVAPPSVRFRVGSVP